MVVVVVVEIGMAVKEPSPVNRSITGTTIVRCQAERRAGSNLSASSAMRVVCVAVAGARIATGCGSITAVRGNLRSDGKEWHEGDAPLLAPSHYKVERQRPLRTSPPTIGKTNRGGPDWGLRLNFTFLFPR